MKTRKQRLSALKRLYAGATYDQVANDFKELKKMLRLEAPERETRSQTKYIPPEDFQRAKQRIPQVFPRDYTRLIVSMYLDCHYDFMARINEVLNVKISDINLEDRFVTLKVTKRNSRTGKMKARIVTFGEELRDKLRIYIQSLPKSQVYLFEKRIAGGIPNGKYTTRAFQKNLQKLRMDCETYYKKDFSFLTSHAIRHTALTEAAAAGTPPSVLKGQSGHSRYETLDRNYYEENILLQRDALDTARRKLKLTRLEAQAV